MRRRWRPYPVDETCKLYLPFYKFGGEQAKIWDLSTSHNDGTIVGASPGTYPMFSPVELMPNQVDRDFSGASAWANVDLNAYNETTDLTITATVAAQYCTCPVASVPTTIGKRYRLYYDLANIVETWTVKSFDGTQTIGTISANVTQGYLDWVASTTGGLRLIAVADTSSGDFDNFSLKEIVGYGGSGWYFDQVDDKVTAVASSTLISVSTGTFLVWFIPITPANVAAEPYNGRGILSDSNLTGMGIYQGIYGGLDRILVFNNDGNYDLVGVTYAINQPICVGWVHSGGNLYVYKNGEFVNSVASGNTNDLTGTLTLGKQTYSVGFGGIILEVLGFNYGFSAQEIRNHFELTRSIYSIF